MPAASAFPAYADHMMRLHETRREVIGAAHEAGVAIYAGTDAGGVLPHGLIGEEVVELATYGLTPAEALGAASWRARTWLGLDDNLSEGTTADFVVFDREPARRPERAGRAEAGGAPRRRRRLTSSRGLWWPSRGLWSSRGGRRDCEFPRVAARLPGWTHHKARVNPPQGPGQRSISGGAAGLAECGLSPACPAPLNRRARHRAASPS